MTEPTRHHPISSNATARRHQVTAWSLTALVAGMIGLSFAAVPLYRAFCQVTGYGGTTQKVEQESVRVLDRIIRVRFDANASADMPWSIRPAQRTIDIRIGETALVFFKARNDWPSTVHGTASYNVTPEIAGSYFNKIECFCFTEQVLKSGEETDMPVTFFIDPEIVEDPDAKDIREITLSYTFFRTDDKTSNTNKIREKTRTQNTGS